MLKSLAACCPEAHVFVLCMDDMTFEILGKLGCNSVELLRLSEVEDESLFAVKPGRGAAEYCWTLTPCLTWHIFARFQEVQQLTYLDADLLFFSPVEPLFEEIGAQSIAIVEHRFIPRLREEEINGRFNVEWVTFRRDAQGMACLAKWREQCIAWCFNRLEEGRMGDQKYLDAWPETYSSLCIIQHLGAGVGPWNYANYEIRPTAQGIMINDVLLIFYHFHQFQMLNYGRFDYMASVYTLEKIPPPEIYGAYERALREAAEKVQKIDPGFSYGIKPWLPVMMRRLVQNYVPRRLKSLLKNIVQT